ncbi:MULTISPECIES: hypothetical protein [unclassified Pseudarthrobacter]|uniref:hypothetical protein n=1 Tax=unclassified Pseudarthrobacter TaxID=2647000 RepID=UPI0036375BD3
MSHSQFSTFLREATYLDASSCANMDPDKLFGLYTSWCFINQQPLGTESNFWAAMEALGTQHGNGLRMKGATAVDYIMATYPKLV